MNYLKKPFLNLVFSLFILFIMQTTPSYALSIENEVLTLQEAAIFLRIEQNELENLAIRNALPGRLVGTEWRFSKTALLNWLSGQEIKQEPVLSVYEMSRIAGRGSGSVAEGNPGLPVVDKKPEVIGNKPDLATAEDIFLRNEKVLLKARELSVEWGMLYSYSDRQDILSSSERESFNLALGFRYGLADNLQFFSSIPLAYQTETATTFEERTQERKSQFGTAVSGIFPQGDTQTRKQFSLQLGLTSLLSKDLYIEPSVSFGLNRTASDVTLGASIVYTIGH